MVGFRAHPQGGAHEPNLRTAEEGFHHRGAVAGVAKKRVIYLLTVNAIPMNAVGFNGIVGIGWGAGFLIWMLSRLVVGDPLLGTSARSNTDAVLVR